MLAKVGHYCIATMIIVVLKVMSLTVSDKESKDDWTKGVENKMRHIKSE